MSLSIPFDNSYARLPDSLFAHQRPTSVRDPKLIVFNQKLAEDIGITGADDTSELAQVFSGNSLPAAATPIAQLYAGHQFGNWNPQLGDGRAVLLGETKGYDIQLKGSGPTPFSRRGDGRAWLGPVLREYVLSEAMHALGVPTTRALAAVETGEEVIRERPLPGAVLTRVASSHIRVGTFQALMARRDQDGLKALFDYACARHSPSASTPAEFLQAVMERQARLIAKWMSLGFIHGVMNTDNCAISGETLDYGPCAFMDAFHPGKVFSSIDQHGRYAYGNQPDIAVWNMAQLATALLPLEGETDAAVEKFTDMVNAMPDLIRSAWRAEFSEKLGLRTSDDTTDKLVGQLLGMMTDTEADFTNSFIALSQDLVEDTAFANHKDCAQWQMEWRAQRSDDAEARMQKANPLRIPRNHIVESMIQAATAGDFAPFHALNAALETPYVADPNLDSYGMPPKPEESVQRTFCGT